MRSNPWTADVSIAVLLFVVAAAWFAWLATGASATGVLTGEEASVTQRDAMAVAMGWQPSIWSTNVASQIYYWAAGHLDPHFGLLYARKWKALGTALLAPLLFVVARRRLGCGRPAAAAAGLVVTALPGVAMMSWVGTENGLEAVAGVAALYVVTSTGRWWPLGVVLAGLSVSLYTAGLAWALVVVVAALTRIRSPRTALAAAAGLAGGAAAIFWPLLWWDNGGQLVTGGGRGGATFSNVGPLLLQVVTYAVGSGRSYYYFSTLPTLGDRWIAGALVVAAVAAVVVRPASRWWAAVLLAAVGLYAISSGVPGARRLIAVWVVLALLAATGLDVAARAVRGRSLLRLTAAAAATAVVVGIVVVPVAGTIPWRAQIASGRSALPIDWPLHVDPGGTESSTLARLDGDLRAGRATPAEVGQEHGGTRTLALLFMLDARTGHEPAVTPEEIREYYRSTGDCRLLDGPRC